LEFSFDRSNESRLRNTSTQTSSAPRPDTVEANQPYDDGIDTSTISNDRLRKAIERNRARQAERNKQQAQARPQAEVHEQASFFDGQAPQAEQLPPEKPKVEERVRPVRASATTVVTRKSVARPNEADFTPVKRAPRKVSSQISYNTTSKRKSKPLNPALVSYLVKGSWAFCAIMVLRLIFANGGVTDYYSQRSIHADRLNELDQIKKENIQLVREIERMQNDLSFQKKLVRDNLGFIASDEFLVLFPKEKSIQ